MSIIDFAQAKEKMEQRKFDEIVEEAMTEDEIIHDFSSNAVLDIIDVLSEIGYDVQDNTECVKDVLMLAEAIAALMHRIKSREYPLHSIADNLFEVSDYDAALQIILDMGQDDDDEE